MQCINKYCLVLLLLVVLQVPAIAEKPSILLQTGWMFMPGDDPAWATPEFDDTDWHNISPLKRWDKQGFPEDLQVVWYRIAFKLPPDWFEDAQDTDLLEIFLNKIDDTDQTYLNGHLIGVNGETLATGQEATSGEGDINAYNYLRRYQLPIDDARINRNGVNVLAIRVHNHLGNGGMYNKGQGVAIVPASAKQTGVPGRIDPGPGALDIAGYWKFKPGDDMAWKEPGFDHAGWDSITAGGQWTWHGYEIDGYAWYRKQFYLPASLKAESVFQESIRLTIGAIQDKGEIFVNGRPIADYRRVTSDNKDYPVSWGFPLIYEFPYDSDIFAWDQINTIAVRVYNDNPQMTDLRGGGMRGKPYLLQVLNFKDYVRVFRGNDLPVHIVPGKAVPLAYTLSNRSRHTDVQATLQVSIRERTSGEIVWRNKSMNGLEPGQTRQVQFTFVPEKPAVYTLDFQVLDAQGQAQISGSQVFGYAEQSAYYKAIKPKTKVAIRVAPVYTPFSPWQQQPGGLLGERMHTNIAAGLMQIDEQALLSGYYAGSAFGSPIGEFVNKYIQAGAEISSLSVNSELYHKTARMVDILIACQREDGYLGTYEDHARWTEWDVWVNKHALIGLLSWYQAHGYGPALKAACKLADLFCRDFGDAPGQLDLISKGPHAGMASSSLLDPMVELYKATGEPRYLDFCHYILRAIEQEHGPKIMSVLESTGRVDKVGNAKGYEMISNLIGMVKLYQVTGEERLLKVALIAWQDIVVKRLYITGSSTVSEAFQDDHVLPGDEGVDPCESCVSVFWLYFNRELFYLTGNVKYAEEIEKTVYNHLLAAQHPHNNAICYFTPLLGHKKYVKNDAICCNASLTRNIARLPRVTVTKSADQGLAVLLYNPGSMRDRIRTSSGSELDFNMIIDTDYPVSGAVKMRVNPEQAAAFSINLRVPAWCRKYTAVVNGKTYSGGPGTFLSIQRTWQPGDLITIDMDMHDRWIDGGQSYPGYVAIAHGPQVLAVDRSVNADLDWSQLNIDKSATPHLIYNTNDLPETWSGAQAWRTPALTVQKRLVQLVPFNVAGQSGGEYRIWLK